jgi:hypothetical protein
MAKRSFFTALILFLIVTPLTAQTTAPVAREQFIALPLAKAGASEAGTNILDRYGVPFIEEVLP